MDAASISLKKTQEGFSSQAVGLYNRSTIESKYRAIITKWLKKNPFYCIAEFIESDMSVGM